MSTFKKPAAITQAIAVIILWLCVVLVACIYFSIKKGTLSSPFGAVEITRFISVEQLVMFSVAGVLLFLVAKAIGHRAKDEDRIRADSLADSGLDEVGSAFYHFGALLMVSASVGAPPWYVLVAIAFFYVGYRMKPA